MTKMSHSRLNTYKECGKKYYFRYIEGVDSTDIFTPLLFGSALDDTLNFVLECKRDGIPIDFEEVKLMFVDKLSNYEGRNIQNSPDVIYTKNDISFYLLEQEDIDYFSSLDEGFLTIQDKSKIEHEKFAEDFKKAFPAEYQYLGWTSLYRKGIAMLRAYIDEVLPQLTRIIKVQDRQVVNNGEGDELIFIVDLIAEYQGKIVVFDNKTTSRPYPEDSVRKSQQLATYNEFYDTEWSGYITMDKLIRKDKKIRIQIIVDKIPTKFTEEVFEDYQDGISGIKQELFDKNPKSCYAYGRRCEFYNLCYNGSYDKLKTRERK